MAGTSSIRKKLNRLAEGETGSNVLEFALVFLIFVMVIFAIVEGSLLYFSNNTVKRAAREGVRVSAASGGFTYGYPGSAYDKIKKVLGSGGINEGELIIDPSMTVPEEIPDGEYRVIVNYAYPDGQRPSQNNPRVNVGQKVEVMVVYRYVPKTGIAAGIFGRARSVSADYVARSEPI